jgi:hypothetical protein
MQIIDAQESRIADHQVCVVYDTKTGAIAHIHQSVTFEGAEVPSKEQLESRAKDLAVKFATPPSEPSHPRAKALAREFAARFRGIKLDRLDVLHLKPEELTGEPMKVNTRSRRLVPVAAKRSSPRKAKRRIKSRKS